MRRLSIALTIPFLLLVSTAALSAQEEPKFLFGLENRFGEPLEYRGADFSWGVVPNFSYFLSERLRLDAFAGLAWSESDDFSLSLQPGLRYYLRPGPGKLRLNTGFSIGFELIDNTGDKFDPERLEALGLRAAEFQDDDSVWLRLVPIELEYWSFKRTAFTFSLDYQTRLFEDSGTGEDNFGVAVGLRYKIR